MNSPWIKRKVITGIQLEIQHENGIAYRIRQYAEHYYTVEKQYKTLIRKKEKWYNPLKFDNGLPAHYDTHVGAKRVINKLIKEDKKD